jgi:hypothetical protein
MTGLRLVALLVPLLGPLLGIAACQIVDDIRYKPKVGPVQPDAPPPALCPVIPGDTCGDSNPTVDVSFSRDIQPLINRTTGGGCMVHTMMPTTPTILLDMSSYATLRKGGVISGDRIIIDCKPCDSLLVRKMDPMPPFGARMPNNGFFWSDVEMTLLRDWIAEGAQDN